MQTMSIKSSIINYKEQYYQYLFPRDIKFIELWNFLWNIIWSESKSCYWDKTMYKSFKDLIFLYQILKKNIKF